MCLNCPAALYYNGGVLRGNILFMLRYVAALNASPPRLFASDLVKVMPCVLMADGKSIAPGLSDVVIQGQPVWSAIFILCARFVITCCTGIDFNDYSASLEVGNVLTSVL